MASRWFIFWIACWVIASIKGYDSYLIFLIFAAFTSDGVSDKLKEFIKKNSG